jgi:hypothetical protein
MHLYLQLDMDARLGLPFQAGSHFVLLGCRRCNDLPTNEYFKPGPLPPGFWHKYSGHFVAALFRPGDANTFVPLPGYLVPARIEVIDTRDDDELRTRMRVGGEPDWLQSPEDHACGCGAPMHLICQIPEDYGFPQRRGAPKQVDGFASDEYGLFLGNTTYVFGCGAQCHERAVWIAVQN